MPRQSPCLTSCQSLHRREVRECQLFVRRYSIAICPSACQKEQFTIAMTLIPNSIGGIALLVATCSAILCWLLRGARSTNVRWGIPMFVSLALSYSIYWLPVWRGANPAEYSPWAAIGSGVPFLAGVIASIIVNGMINWPRAKRKG